jgi:Uma2 family endonuclease
MWDLEYLLLFGVPSNKWELWDSRVRWAFPFLGHDVARAHFDAWSDTLCRWRGANDARVRQSKTANGTPKRTLELEGVEMGLYPRPIELRMHVEFSVFDAIYDSFWRRDLWPGQDPGRETGWECSQRHADVQHNLWKLFREFCHDFGGQHCGRSTIALDDRNAVEPDHYYFAGSRKECTIDGGYFQGVPRLIAEVLSPSTRALERGPRMDVYRRAGVPHLWLLDPETETVEEYALTRGVFEKTGHHGAGEAFQSALFAQKTVELDSLFDTQEKRHGFSLTPVGSPRQPKEWNARDEISRSRYAGTAPLRTQTILRAQNVQSCGAPLRSRQIRNCRPAPERTRASCFGLALEVNVKGGAVSRVGSL